MACAPRGNRTLSARLPPDAPLSAAASKLVCGGARGAQSDRVVLRGPRKRCGWHRETRSARMLAWRQQRFTGPES